MALGCAPLAPSAIGKLPTERVGSFLPGAFLSGQKSLVVERAEARKGRKKDEEDDKPGVRCQYVAVPRTASGVSPVQLRKAR
jgi:hypothetical protein